jgi:hypothetical protein
LRYIQLTKNIPKVAVTNGLLQLQECLACFDALLHGSAPHGIEFLHQRHDLLLQQPDV